MQSEERIRSALVAELVLLDAAVSAGRTGVAERHRRAAHAYGFSLLQLLMDPAAPLDPAAGAMDPPRSATDLVAARRAAAREGLDRILAAG